MKITHNKVGQNLNLLDTTKSDGANKADKIKSAKTDLREMGKEVRESDIKDATRVEVSARAQEAKKIKELAMAAPDVDEAKVAKFRKLIEEGNYKVDAKDIADKMVDSHLEMSN